MTRQSDIENMKERITALLLWIENANAIVGQAIAKAKASLCALKEEIAGRARPARRR